MSELRKAITEWYEKRSRTRKDEAELPTQNPKPDHADKGKKKDRGS